MQCAYSAHVPCRERRGRKRKERGRKRGDRGRGKEGGKKGELGKTKCRNKHKNKIVSNEKRREESVKRLYPISNGSDDSN